MDYNLQQLKQLISQQLAPKSTPLGAQGNSYQQ
jgi:hypothetical protein